MCLKHFKVCYRFNAHNRARKENRVPQDTQKKKHTNENITKNPKLTSPLFIHHKSYKNIHKSILTLRSNIHES